MRFSNPREPNRFAWIKRTLVAAASTAVLGISSIASAQVSVDDLTVNSAASVRATVELSGHTSGMFLVRLADPAVAVYDGGIKGYPATSARANGKNKFESSSPAAKKYQKRLEQQQRKALKSAAKKFGRDLQVNYTYQHAVNGFAVELTADEAKALANMDGVVSVQRERVEHITTDVGPTWIGAPEVWNSNISGSQGEGLVVAVFDSGVNSDHPSFEDISGDGYDHTNPLGSGNYLPGSYCDTVDPTFCNDKLIGAWDFTDIDGTVPEDDDGHGSHTASTAAGNVVIGAELVAPTTSASFDISGVAPRANVIAYDVCQQTCPGSALVAAVNQVVIDAGNLPNGIAALNYSISGGGNPYNDIIELGFLNATQVGIYVSASAGNSGPDASTVAHLGPWVSTTAASTHNRSIGNSLVSLSSDAAGLADIAGSSFSAGYGPAPIIHANTTEFDPDGQCLEPFPAGTFNGEIVVCDRGSIARTAKGQNVLAGGAGGYVLANLGQGEGTTADAHFLPAVHIGDSAGVALREWLASNTNTVATITPFSFDFDASNGDVMAGFSSRGPQLVFDVLKPDVTAPGVNIMGAEADGQGLSNPEYQIISGTSMSSPHNAGAGALMRAAHPDWTPAEIKSALMMTSTTENTRKEDGVTPTDPFDLGAGRIQVDKAVDAGLAMDESAENFLAANPETGGDPSTLNLASMMDSNCVGTCSWTRTVTNKMNNTGHWNVTVSGVGFDTEVSVSPQANSGANNLKLKSGQSATITVTATNFTSEEGWQFGTLNLDRAGSSGPDLHMPMAVFASKASNPSLFTKTVDSDTASAGDTLSYEINITNGPLSGPLTVTDAIPAGATFVPGSETESITLGVTTSPWAYDAGTNSLTWEGELNPGGIRVGADGNIFGYFSLGGIGIAPEPFPDNCDDGGIIFNVPSFTFNGESYSEVIWSVNGTLEAGTASGLATSFDNQNFPDSTPPNNLLAPYWRDLNGCDGGSWTVGNLSAGPFSWTVFEWTDIPHFGSTDAATFQVWLLADTSPQGVLPSVHYTYGRLDNVNAGLTVGAENADGTDGVSYFFNGVGTPPQVNQDLSIGVVPGGSLTLGFEVEADCSDDLIVNEANLTGTDSSEVAIAVTSCE